MPRPRFQNLPEDRRRNLLETAAAEFGRSGFEQASQNRIIEAAGISKGAFYYYFDDKEDLFITVMKNAADRMLQGLEPMPDATTAASYWSGLRDHYVLLIDYLMDHPLDAALFKTLGPGMPASERIQRELREMVEGSSNWFVRVLSHGQQLGAVRNDIPLDLLIAMIMGMGEAHDYWMAANWDKLEKSPGGITAHVERMMGLFRGMLEVD